MLATVSPLEHHEVETSGLLWGLRVASPTMGIFVLVDSAFQGIKGLRSTWPGLMACILAELDFLRYLNLLGARNGSED